MMGAKWEKILMKVNVSMQERDYSAQMSAIYGAKTAASMLRRSDNDNRKKAAEAADAMAAVEAVDAVVGAADDISRNAKQVAAACGLEIPKAKKSVLAIVLV
ncbi:MAG: hypothetical protein LUD73_06070, partial [Lachnospiraceae bacterium]|nr:hypothetical protein [Lachnospiraceae bacterium]